MYTQRDNMYLKIWLIPALTLLAMTSVWADTKFSPIPKEITLRRSKMTKGDGVKPESVEMIVLVQGEKPAPRRSAWGSLTEAMVGIVDIFAPDIERVSTSLKEYYGTDIPWKTKEPTVEYISPKDRDALLKRVAALDAAGYLRKGSNEITNESTGKKEKHYFFY